MNLFEYCLRMGDNALILGHRLSEWCGHGPILEEDIAMINIALDHIGQATSILKYAAEIENKGRTEDDLAYFRDAQNFRNALLVEQENGDFAVTMARQFYYTTFSYLFFEALKNSKDATLAAIAEKSLKEVTYHLRHSSEWIVRMGDGTDESKERVQNAINDLWMYTGDLFTMNEVDNDLLKQGIAVDLTALKPKWDTMVADVLKRATLTMPTSIYMQQGSKEGKHTEHLGFLLAEMQYLQRTYPGAQW
jgi:ring-1,2-phenylacetyl-CoA epoxidase subunit PaaC